MTGAVVIGLIAGVLAVGVCTTFGFHPLYTAVSAWLGALAAAALALSRATQGAWCDGKAAAGIVATVNLLFVALLVWQGPQRLAPEQALRENLPIHVAVTGVSVELREDTDGEPKAATVALGPEPLTTPADPYVVVPGIPRSGQGGHAPNAPVELHVECAGAQCVLRVSDLGEGSATGVRRDYLVGARQQGSQPWRILGALDIPSGSSIEMRPADHREGTTTTLEIETDDDMLRLGTCEIPRPDEGTLYLPVAELPFIDAEAQPCRSLPIEQRDSFAGAWLRRASDGSIEIPAHSMLALSPDGLRFLRLEDRAWSVVLRGPDDRPLEIPASIELSFDASDPVEVAVLQRRFRETPWSAAEAEQCTQSWDEATALPWQDGAAKCRRMSAALYTLPLRVGVDREHGRVRIDLDKRSDRWTTLAWIEIPPRRFVRWRDELETPRRFLLGGTEAELGDEVLRPPFRLLPLAQNTSLSFARDGVDGVTARIRDGLDRGVVDLPARLEIGPPRAATVLELERAVAPWSLARRAMAPSLLLSIVLVALAWSPLGRRRPWGRAVVIASTALVIVAFATLQKALVAYAVIVHAPYDWEAFDQLVVAAIVLPLAIGAAMAAGVLVRPVLARVSGHRSELWMAMAAVLVWLAVVRGSMSVLGRESLGVLRFVGLTPLVAAVAWAFVRSSRDVRIVPRWVVDTVLVVVLAITVLSWWRDKGAMLLLGLPVLMALTLHHGSTKAVRVATWGAVIAATIVIAAPRLLVGTWSRVEQIRLTDLPGGQPSTCERDAGDWVAPTADCSTPTSDAPALAVLDEQGLISTDAGVSGRRHPLRRLDWLEDGAGLEDEACYAVDRLPTRDAMEVGFFRALVRTYRSEGDLQRVYLRDDLLPFSAGVSDALLNDYPGMVQFVPQLPRGSLTSVALALGFLVLVGSACARPWGTAVGAAGLGSLVLLSTAAAMTVAANLDVFPNFAQSLPLLALRSNTAWVLDGSALFLGVFGVVASRAAAQEGPA